MVLNPFGVIANQQLLWLAEQYRYVCLHAAVVMPNHVHAIIQIDDRLVSVGTGRDLSINKTGDLHDDETNGSGTGHDLSLPPTKNKSLSQLMGAYKTTSSKQIHEAGLAAFAWQRSFHDHIIRNEESFQRISAYIHNNPTNWQGDKLFNQ